MHYNKANVKTEESAMAVVICGDKILTITEMVYGKTILSLPKGHTEQNETPLDTSIRECFEETNVVIDKSQLIKELTPYSYEFSTPSGQLIRKTLIPFLFSASDFGRPLPKEERMISVKWMDIEEFLSLCPYQTVKGTVGEALALLKQ